MKRNLILTGWHHPEYLAAAAAVYGGRCKCEADVLGVSMAGLAAALDTYGRHYRQVDVLGVGLTENLEKLSRVLKELAADGVSVRWVSRQEMPEATSLALERAGASFAEVAVRAKHSLLDVVVDVFGDEEGACVRLKPLCKVADIAFGDFPDMATCTEPEIWATLYLAAGFAHRDHHDETACGDVVRALWKKKPVRPRLPPRLEQLMEDYRSGYSKEIVGRSQVMVDLRARLTQAAKYGRANVLLLGETGTGKQVAAEYVHNRSSRRQGPFEHFNCAYGNGCGNLLMDRLFGHEKGAFTGALTATRGLFDDADGGTLFLDEIGEAKEDVQSMLLTVLETGCFTRIGGDRTKIVRVDVRLVCATNRDLQQMVLDGDFRLDLYERICEFPVRLEPLRNHREDIEPLARHYWRQMTGGKLTPRQVRDLCDYDYPGNVRELLSLLKQAQTLSSADAAKSGHQAVDFKSILDSHKSFNGKLIEGLARRRDAANGVEAGDEAVEWPDSKEELLVRHVARMYEKYGRRIVDAAAKAEMSLNTFKKYLAKAREQGLLEMPRKRGLNVVAGIVLAAASLLLPLQGFAGSVATIRSKADMRLWETVSDRSKPLSWPWENGADSATIVFSNRVARSISMVTVSRGAGEIRGSCAQPVPQEGEALFDVTLVQKAGANEISRESASLAYVSGAGGGPIAVRVLGTHDWRIRLVPRIFAFDPAWQGGSGESGYDIAWPNYCGTRFTFR